jgi:hypothetical protein
LARSAQSPVHSQLTVTVLAVTSALTTPHGLPTSWPFQPPGGFGKNIGIIFAHPRQLPFLAACSHVRCQGLGRGRSSPAFAEQQRSSQTRTEGSSPAEALPIRSDTQAKLVIAIAHARQWLSEIEAGAATIDGIASRQACSKRHVSMTISLAFLDPSLVKAAVNGQLPRGIGVARLFDAPVAWSRQHQMLGLSP